MASRWYPSPDEEEAEILRVSKTRSTEAAADPMIRSRVRAIKHNYPHAPSSLIWALARTGHDEDSPLTKQMVERAIKVKVKKSGFLANVGDFVKVGKKLGGAALGEVGDVAKGAARTGFTLLAAPAEGIDASARSLARNVHEKGWAGGIPAWVTDDGSKYGPQTSAGVALKQYQDTGKADLGTGFFAGGSVREQQAEHARASYQVDGHAGTVGRIIARNIFEPGSKPYNVLSGATDAAVDIWGDPASKAMSAAGRARQADKLLVAAGGVKAARNTALPEVVENFTRSKQYAKLTDWVAQEPNLNRIRTQFKNQVPVDDLVRLRDAGTPDEVDDILRPLLGINLREKPGRPGFPTRVTEKAFRVTVQRSPREIRLLQQMPGSQLVLSKPEEALEHWDRALRNLNLPGDVVDSKVEELARAMGRDSNVDAFNVVTDTIGDVAKKLDQTVGRVNSRQLTRMWGTGLKELRKYFVDEIGMDMPVLGAVVDGAEHALPTPHLFVEYLDDVIPLPDARALRQATSAMGRLAVKVPGGQLPNAVLDKFMGNVFKPMVLLRPAWTLRVVGEEQVRMAAAGLSSVVHHPLSAMLWATGRKGKLDITGNAFEDAADFGRALSQRSGGWRNRIAAAGKVIYDRFDPEYAKAWGDELGQLAADPVAKRVAGGFASGDAIPGGLTGNHIEDAKRWFWDGAGSKFRTEMGRSAGREGLLTDRAISDGYIDSIAKRISIKTTDHEELMDAVRTGKLNGHDITRGDATAARQVTRRLRSMADEEIGPQNVKGDLALRVGVGGKYDHAVEFMFNALMTKPTNFLSRSPAFKQYYWKRAEELIGSLDDAAQTAALKAAKDAGLSRKELQALAKNALASKGELGLDELDELAKGHALDNTRHLLYDLTDRSQFFDITRNIFPFGEAWNEVLTRWAKLSTDNPAIFRRAQQGVEGARGSGFFHTDEQTGEEMFTYPFSEQLTDKFLDMPVGLQGRVAGLNIFSGGVVFMPGVGPAVQWPAQMLLPDKPEWDGVRDLILPFGDSNVEGGVVESMLPSWFQKIRQAGWTPFGRQDDRVWNSTVGEVQRYLFSTGDYDLSTEDGQRKLTKDATEKAKYLYLMRGLAQSALPSSPSFKFTMADGNGIKRTAYELTKDFQKMQEEDFDTAIPNFLEKYGDGALLYMQPKSQGLFPATTSAEKWVRANPDIAEKFPKVYGYFAPGGDDDFDFNAYNRQLRTGERKPLSPEQQIKLANAKLASMIYHQASERVKDRNDEAASEWLRQVKDKLLTKYHGYGDYLAEKPDSQAGRDRDIRQMREALKDPRVASTEAGKAIKIYLERRDQAIEASKRIKVNGKHLASPFKAKKARALRDWLRDTGDQLSTKFPDFQPTWERLFSREFVAEEEAEAA